MVGLNGESRDFLLIKDTDDYGLEVLRKLRYGYSDEIPVEMVHSTSPNSKYKCRMGWWQTLASTLDYLFLMDAVPRDFVNEYKQILNNLRANLIQNKGLTQLSDIEMGNEFVDKVIRHLEIRVFGIGEEMVMRDEFHPEEV